VSSQVLPPSEPTDEGPVVVGAPSDRGQIRGSGLLLVGRLIGLAIGLVAQVLVVRYLTKGDFGAFAYVLAVVDVSSSLATFALDKTLSRYLSVYAERNDRGSALGSIVLAIGVMSALGLTAALIFFGLQHFGLAFADPATSMALILVLLIPIDALEPLFTVIFASFGRVRAIFFRVHILGPVLRLGVVASLLVGGGDLFWLAAGWVAAGATGIAVSVPLLRKLLVSQGYLDRDVRRQMRLPLRDLFGHSLPLLSADLVFLLRSGLVPVFIALFLTTAEVADYTVVFPLARLNLVVVGSFTFLFLPAAARLFARGDEPGMAALYWRSALWVALLSFPVFAATFALAPALVETLYGERYEASAAILSVLALGLFVRAAFGMAGLTLRAVGRMRYLFFSDISTAVLALVSYAALIPSFGALGASVGASATMILQVVLYQAGLPRTIRGAILQRVNLRVYLSMTVAIVALFSMQLLIAPPLWLGLAVTLATSLLLLWAHRGVLELGASFPELRRIPLLGRFV
jgi:O-antigen/teichoic acid export membrane protein